ncbi:biotin--[acetyl-CoA-carboxylase] ligase [Roseicella sp. DB1501]|uniref:biotin--[acetyl-CoA-carboxylase] ligase n=1 Tax=Roseicella sp. DB1501 TaxID=2730925 RepID=UPI00149238E9|nr:biotin--[acetyl-CoA-carboxylase] ligase [Roseicella sp. DB1501]
MSGPGEGRGPAPPVAWRLERYAALPSTADLLNARAEAGEAEGLAILADEQLAGRGRAGRGWTSPPGNLYLSVLLRPAGPAREAPQWSLLAAVALAEAASALVADPGAVRLKWPNDLLVGGGKAAGILVESVLSATGGIAWLGLGFGVNLLHAPALPDRPTATLGGAERPERFAARLLARLGHWVGVQRQAGFAPVRTAWSRFGPDPGEAIAVRGLPEKGGFAGLAEDGSLLLDIGGRRRAIPAGEILSQGNDKRGA